MEEIKKMSYNTYNEYVTITEILGETGRMFLGVLGMIFALIYVINPIDVPGPIDDFIVLILGAYLARWGFDLPPLRGRR